MQKLEKVQLGLQEEERMRNDLKDRYAAAIGEQKRCYSLMKAFQVGFFSIQCMVASLGSVWVSSLFKHLDERKF